MLQGQMWVYMLGATVSCLQPTFVIAQNWMYLSVLKKKTHFFFISSLLHLILDYICIK